MGAIRRIFQTMGFQDSMVKTYIDGMATKPSLDHIRLIEAFVRVVKPILVVKADVFYFGNINNSADSFRNLVKNAHHGTMQGSGLVWDNLVGFTNPNGTGWVNTHYNPATQGIKYTLNDAGIGVNIHKHTSAVSLRALGCSDINGYITMNINYPPTISYMLNTAFGSTTAALPFTSGFHAMKRLSSTSSQFQNQNTVNATSTVVSNSIPNSNITLFKMNGGTTGFEFTGGLNCVYMGSSLTDAEYITLNTAINEYLIGCLFLKYGADNWGVKMAKSYFYDLHGFEKYEAFEVYEFLKRHQPEYNPYPQPELSVNSGAVGLTDWVDSNADGVANTWSTTTHLTYPSIGSIVTGNGFIGNAQRVIENNTSNAYWLGNSSIRLELGVTYKISFKQRNSNGIFMYMEPGSAIFTITTTPNIANASIIEFNYVAPISGYIVFYGYNNIAGCWLELDELSIKPVKDYHTPELSLNSGAPGLSDWVDITGDGLANGMSNGAYACTNTIVTGNGFTGNAQRATENNIENIANLILTETTLIAGVQYLITGKYQSLTVLHIKHSVDGLIRELPINGGNAQSFSFLYVPSTDGTINFITGLATAGAWITLDEISAQSVVNISEELLINSGAAGLTDWVDSNADGLADRWILTSSTPQPVSPTIISDGLNGFTGRVQRITNINLTNLSMIIPTYTLTVGKYYTISFKYRSNTSLTVSNALGGGTYSSNLLDAISVVVTAKCVSTAYLRFYLNATSIGDWLEIDEVSIKEVITSGTELCINTGNASTTDWVDGPDGLADDWSITYNSTYPSIASIVTGNGFTGNAQRVIENNAAHIVYLSKPTTMIFAGKTYTVSGKYRASGNLKFNPAQGAIITWASNTGNAIAFSVTFTCTISSWPSFYSTVGAVGDWFEIDEVSIKEVTESDIVNFNKCLNSGFGLATDFVDSDGNGVADNWTPTTSNYIPTIVTGNGFDKRAQRMEKHTDIGKMYIMQFPKDILTIGHSYTIYLKFRSSSVINVCKYTSTGINYLTIGSNTGDAIAWSGVFTATDVQYFSIGLFSAQVGDWFEVSEILVIDNTNSQFYYNVFGPNGLNKTISDYIMLFKAGGNLIANAWAKTGATLRWNQDGSVANSNTMPAYTRGSNLGIVTVTSTDGWNELTQMIMAQTANSINSYYGNTPLVNKIRIGASKVITVQSYNGKMKTNVIGNTNAFNGLYCINTSYPGYCKITVQDMIGKSWNTLGTFGNLPINPIVTSRLIGCVTELTTEFAGPSSINMVASNELYGSLKNVVHQNTCSGGYYFYDTNIVEGFSSWSKIIPILHFGNCKLPTDAVNAQLKVINDYFAVNTPIKSVTINLSGASMGIPTGGANNTDLLGIIAKHAAAGFTATITVRTS